MNYPIITDCIGGSRGEVAMRLLLEMNHEVRGDCVQETLEQVRHFFLITEIIKVTITWLELGHSIAI